MTKTELTTEVANQKGSPIAAARKDVDMVLNCIVGALTQGEEVKLAGLGTFKVITLKARKARNPKTGETVDVPAKKKVKFIAAKELKERLS